MCHCDDQLVLKLEQDFKKILQQQTSLEQWAEWLDGVVGTVLQPHEGHPGYPRAARQFLLKWSFYSSMVIRDLTLRSAASFGSFHLIRLLYDEYMFFLVEHKVAAHLGQTPVAVVGELGKSPDFEEVPNTREVELNASGESVTESASELHFRQSVGTPTDGQVAGLAVTASTAPPTILASPQQSKLGGQSVDVAGGGVNSDETTNSHHPSSITDSTAPLLVTGIVHSSNASAAAINVSRHM